MLIAFAILPFFSTLLGGSAAIRLRHRLHPFMAFAAGVLVATALADLLPEATDLIGPSASPAVPGAAAVVGFLLFSALEAFVHRETWEHEHQRVASGSDSSDPHARLVPTEQAGSALGLVGPLSLVAHSTLDGLAPVIGAAIGTFADLNNMVLGFLLAGFAGVFLAVGAGHLLPEAHHRRPGASPLLVLLTAAGAGVVLVIRSIAG
jgi:zinc transporter ZupT